MRNASGATLRVSIQAPSRPRRPSVRTVRTRSATEASRRVVCPGVAVAALPSSPCGQSPAARRGERKGAVVVTLHEPALGQQ